MCGRCARRCRECSTSRGTRAGHEIRNPLHGLAAGVDACLSGELTPAELRTELIAIADGVRMMASLTNDLLDLQKMRAGKMSVKSEVASPRGIVQACVRAVQPAVSVPIDIGIDADVPEWVRRVQRARVWAYS
jgi:signal transduction histidine kinase